jgi:hypothetical protein
LALRSAKVLVENPEPFSYFFFFCHVMGYSKELIAAMISSAKRSESVPTASGNTLSQY